MTKRTPTGDDTDALAGARAICGHLDRKGDIQRVCVRDPHDPHDDPKHNMYPATPELARSLAKRGVTGGPGIDQLGMVHPGEYHEAPDHWTCAARVRDALDNSVHYCDRHDKHDPDPAVQGHYWVAVSAPTVDLDGDTLVTGNRDVLPAVPPDGAQTADPPATPGTSGETPEPSGETPTSPAGSGGGSGRPSTSGQSVDRPPIPTRPERSTGMEAEATAGRALEPAGQVAASFGTSTGDVPFQAALMSVLVPAARDDEAHILADEMAQLGGLLATAGRIASEYHRHGRLAEPGLLVALRFQANALCVGRGLQP